jgi:hypothetical protein
MQFLSTYRPQDNLQSRGSKQRKQFLLANHTQIINLTNEHSRQTFEVLLSSSLLQQHSLTNQSAYQSYKPDSASGFTRDLLYALMRFFSLSVQPTASLSLLNIFHPGRRCSRARANTFILSI